MKSIYKKGAALAAAALMTVAFAGCGGGDKSASKGPKDTLTVGITNFADSLEPTDNYFGWQVMRYGIGECLVHFDSKMNAEPWIAESWKVSDDKMSWTFKIKDIKFSNGTPVTGEAVKKSIERTFAKSPRAKAMFELDHILWKEVLPNALLPLITLLGLAFGSLLGGAAVVEIVFSWPGLGFMVVQAITYRDFQTVQAVVLWIAFMYMAINLVVDLSYNHLDPRLRKAGQ